MRGSARRLLIPGVLLLLAGSGCSRKFFRERADADVAGVITQKNHFPAWAVKNWFVYPHPDARFADPFNPDRPPYPVDDYAARLLSPNPQRPTKKTGTGRYDGEGYMRLLSEWDAQNRSEDPALAAGARGVSPGPAIVQVGGMQPVEGKLLPGVAGPPAPNIPLLPQPERLPAIPQIPVAQQPADPKQLAEPKPITPPGQFPSVEALMNTGSGDDDYLRALESNQQGFRLKMDQSVDLGLINSREFQDRREDLYLAALPVTLERYNFAAQAFFFETVTRNFTGSDLGAGRLWRIDSSAGLSKRFATGGQLLLKAANDVVLNLGEGKPNVAVSNLGLTFVQPFLRGGGFAVTLEGLTRAERDMVYAMRSYARFRKLYYVAVVAGQNGGNITNNPYGLQGLSVNLGRGIGGNLTSPSVGFLPLLQQAAVIANQRKNVVFLERLLDLYKAYREGGQQSDLQVGQVEVNLLNSRGQLLGSAGGGGGGSGIRGYLDQLDNFKLQLGLPMTVGLDLDESPLKPIRDQLARFEDLYADLRQLEGAALSYNPNNPIAQFRPYWRRLLTEADLVKGTAFARGIIARWDAWAKLTAQQFKARLDEIGKERQKLLAERSDRQVKNLPDPPAAVQRLAELDAELELANFEQSIRMYEAKASPAGFQRVVDAFISVALGARDERVQATRDQWPKLPALPVSGIDVLTADLDTAYTASIQAALSNRLDLMNARGQVVDAYRQIAVQANSLQGVLSVEYDASTTTPAGGSRPFAFSPSRSSQQLIFHGELPLVRRAERNSYRAALIGYQRQRRTLMAFEDNIANDVRSDIRQLRTIAQLYRIQQRVVELAYSQVDNAQALLIAPPVPGATTDPGSAAALTQQVLNNQGNVLNAQNTLYGYWVTYLTIRMKLYLDLELMQLDDRGVWNDEQTTGYDNVPGTGTGGQPPERLPAPQPQPVGPADRK